jgi:predicted RNA binding protein YcfA (HicA-like mRNA interferase family)
MPKIPGIRHKDAIRALEKAGWRVIREGKHTPL